MEFSSKGIVITLFIIDFNYEILQLGAIGKYDKMRKVAFHKKRLFAPSEKAPSQLQYDLSRDAE